jgi:hypothetical protein
MSVVHDIPRCCMMQVAIETGKDFQCSGCGQRWYRGTESTTWFRKLPNIIPIRPSKLFGLVEEEGPERVVQIRIPKRRNPDGPDRSAKLLETMVLLACMKLTKAMRVFEFGTCLGSTAVNLALNGLPHSEIFTLDLDWTSAKTANQTEADRDTTQFGFMNPCEWWPFRSEGSDNPHGHFPLGVLGGEIKPLYGNSTRMSLRSFDNSIDLVWIDGGHDYRTVASDTANAFKMRRSDRLSVVAWHDYKNPECPDIARLLEDERLGQLYWVEDTMVVLHFNREIGL